MIICKPKLGTYLALGLIVTILIGGLVYALHHFANYRTLPTWLYLSATVILTLTLILLLVKMLSGYKFLKVHQNKIIINLPLRNQTIIHPINSILVWDEEIVQSNKRLFKQLTMVFEDKTSFSLSNHEHNGYDELSDFFKKKLGKKQAKSRKKT